MTVGFSAAFFAAALAAGIITLRFKTKRGFPLISTLCFVLAFAALVYCLAALILILGID